MRRRSFMAAVSVALVSCGGSSEPPLVDSGARLDAGGGASAGDARAGDDSSAPGGVDAYVPRGPCASLDGELARAQTFMLPGLGMSIAWSSDDASIAVAGHFRDPASTMRYDSKVYDTATGALLKSFDCHVYFTNAVAWADGTPLGPLLADGSFGHVVRLLDPRSPGSTSCRDGGGQFLPEEGLVTRLGPLNGAVTAVAFSPDATLVAAANRDPSVRVWQLAPGENQFKAVALWFESSSAVGNYVSLAWSPDGSRLATGDRQAGRVAVWSLEDARLTQEQIDAFATVGWDMDAQSRWYTANRTAQAPIWSDGGHGDVWNVRFSPDGGRIAAAGEEGNVSVFDAASGSPLFTLAPPSAVTLRGLDWSPDGRSIAAGASDFSIYVFDVDARALSQTLTGHADEVTAVAWSHDGCALASVAGGPLLSPDNHAVPETDTDPRVHDPVGRIWRRP